MENAIAALLTTFISEFAPIPNVNIKLRLMNLCDHAFTALTKINFPTLKCKMCRRCNFEITHEDTIDGIERYLQSLNSQQCDQFTWKSNRATPHDGMQMSIVFDNKTLYIKKSKGGLRNEEDALTISGPNEAVIVAFIEYTKSLQPHILLIPRPRPVMPTKRARYHEEEPNTIMDYGNLFFERLVAYFMRSETSNRALLGFKGMEVVFCLNTDSFSDLPFTFKDKDQREKQGKVKIRIACDEKNQLVVDALQLESIEMSLEELKQYTMGIYQQQGEYESKTGANKRIRIFECFGGEKWVCNISACSKTFANTIVSHDVEELFIRDLEKFLRSAETYHRRSIPYKRGYALHGPPGTFKSSLIKATARECNLPLFMCNLDTMTSSQFDSLMIEMRLLTHDQPHLLVFEDFDRCDFAKRKDFAKREVPELHRTVWGIPLQDDETKIAPKNRKVSMQQFLNCLDGVNSPDGRIVILTGNDSNLFVNCDKSMQALFRPGRIDKVIEITFANPDQMCRMFTLFFPDSEPLHPEQFIHFKPMTPATFGHLLTTSSAQDIYDMMYGVKPLIVNGTNYVLEKKKEENKEEKQERKRREPKPIDPDTIDITTLKQLTRKYYKSAYEITRIMDNHDKHIVEWSSQTKHIFERMQKQKDMVETIQKRFVSHPTLTMKVDANEKEMMLKLMKRKPRAKKVKEDDATKVQESTKKLKPRAEKGVKTDAMKDAIVETTQTVNDAIVQTLDTNNVETLETKTD